MHAKILEDLPELERALERAEVAQAIVAEQLKLLRARRRIAHSYRGQAAYTHLQLVDAGGKFEKWPGTVVPLIIAPTYSGPSGAVTKEDTPVRPPTTFWPSPRLYSRSEIITDLIFVGFGFVCVIGVALFWFTSTSTGR